MRVIRHFFLLYSDSLNAIFHEVSSTLFRFSWRLRYVRHVNVLNSFVVETVKVLFVAIMFILCET